MPLWSLIEDSKIHIMDIGLKYQEVIDFLTTHGNDPQHILAGQAHLSFTNQHALANSVIYQFLIRPWAHDDTVTVLLGMILPAMARALQRIFADHLEGGRWVDAPAEVRQQAAGLPKHNKFSESVFGHLDPLIREKPNITTIATEAYIMFSHNSTLS